MALRYRLRRTRINIVSHYCWDIPSFRKVIDDVRTYRRGYCNPRKALPFLHIAAHGLRDGLSLGDAEPMPWRLLSKCLLPLQQHIDYTLPMSLSACHGYYGYRLASQEMTEYAKKRPYSVLIGPQYRIATKELFSAFAALYSHLLHSHSSLRAAIQAANREISNSRAHLNYSFGA
jgi:hypothetical protein